LRFANFDDASGLHGHASTSPSTSIQQHRHRSRGEIPRHIIFNRAQCTTAIRSQAAGRNRARRHFRDGFSVDASSNVSKIASSGFDGLGFRESLAVIFGTTPAFLRCHQFFSSE